MGHALKTAKTRFLFTIANSLRVALAAAAHVGIPRDRVFLLEGKGEGLTTMSELLEAGKSYGAKGQVPAWSIPEGQKNKDVCGFLNFSSGTTGLPKAVCGYICPTFQSVSHSCADGKCGAGDVVAPKCHRTMPSAQGHQRAGKEEDHRTAPALSQ